MNFKSLIVVGLSLTTLGLSLPAHAGDTATVIDTNRQAIVTGNDNDTRLNSVNTVRNRQTGRRNASDTGTSIKVDQGADVAGNANTTRINGRNEVNNLLHRR